MKKTTKEPTASNPEPVKAKRGRPRKNTSVKNTDSVYAYEYITKDYAKFSEFPGQRPVSATRLKLLIETIKALSGIKSAIIVDPLFRIIDGMGRFKAAQALGLPIIYKIDYEATPRTYIELNRSQKPPVLKEYSYFYIANGLSDYKVWHDFVTRHKISQTGGITLLSDKSAHGDTVHAFKNGKFKITSKGKAEHVMQLAYSLLPYYTQAKTRGSLYAIKKGIDFGWYNHLAVKFNLMHMKVVPHIPPNLQSNEDFYRSMSKPVSKKEVA